MDYRIEHDTMGEVRVPANHYWGAQTSAATKTFPSVRREFRRK